MIRKANKRLDGYYYTNIVNAPLAILKITGMPTNSYRIGPL